MKKNKKFRKKCEICKKNSHHKHHIISKCYGGTNNPNNIVYLCASCHSETHLGNIIIEGWFMTTKGLQLIWHYKSEESITGLEDSNVYVI